MSKAAPTSRPSGGRRPVVPSGTRGLFRSIGIFAVCLAVAYGVMATPAFERARGAGLETNATVSAWLLNVLGEGASSRGRVVVTPRFQVDIRGGCDAIEPIVLFVAAVLAAPIALRRMLPGLVIGVVTLLLLNFVRILSLYYTGVYFPSAFETMHLDVWQPAFILIAVVLWATWAWWATRAPRGPAA